MKKSKKVYCLTIVFDSDTEEVENLTEEIYEENEPYFPEYEEALSILKKEHPDAPPDWYREAIQEFYSSLLDDSDIYGIA